jgi:hypothetical protein
MVELSRPQAQYRHVLQADGTYGVEVAIEGTNATIVTPFADVAAADRWIEGHRLRASQPRQRLSYGSRKWAKSPTTAG